MFPYICILLLITFANVNANSRILGGVYAKPGQFPYMAYISLPNNSFCGGSIISDQWILTAGHCAEKRGFILLGSNNIKDINFGKNIYEYEEPIIHHKFKFIKLDDGEIYPIYDIALLKLKNKIPQFTPLIQPVKLAHMKLSDISFGILSGWGAIYTNKTTDINTPYLKYTKYAASNTNCLLPNTICPKGVGGVGFRGDSGSPLVLKGIQIGIVSSGDPKIFYEYTMFTFVQVYLEWIQSVTKIAIT